LGREGSFADPGHIRLRDSDHRVDPRRPDADAGRRAASNRRRRGHERIRAVVDVEERAVRALEEDALARPERPVDEERRVRDVWPQPLGVLLVARSQLLELERLGAVGELEPGVVRGWWGLAP